MNIGDQLTKGSRNPHRILEILGHEAVQQYLLYELQRVYAPQGQTVNDKHFEVILRKMLGYVVVVDSGDTEMLPGDIVWSAMFNEENEKALKMNLQPAQGRAILLGVSEAGQEVPGFLVPASAQDTVAVLSQAALEARVDTLIAPWARVMLGSLPRTGTGSGTEE